MVGRGHGSKPHLGYPPMLLFGKHPSKSSNQANQARSTPWLDHFGTTALFLHEEASMLPRLVPIQSEDCIIVPKKILGIQKKKSSDIQ